MYDIFFDLICKWNHREQEQFHYLRLFPDYPQAAKNLASSSAAFLTALEGVASQAYRLYEEARNHMAALSEDAAFLAGLRAGLRLWLKL